MTVRRKPTFILLVFVISMLSALTGCSGPKKETADVSFMYCFDAPGTSAKMERWLHEYSGQTGKTVKDLSAPYEGYGQKLVVLLGARQAPDLFFLTPDELPNFIEKGAVLALDSLVEKEQFTYPDRQKYPHLYGADGKLYAVQLDERSVYVIFARTAHKTESWNLLKFLLQKTGKD